MCGDIPRWNKIRNDFHELSYSADQNQNKHNKYEWSREQRSLRAKKKKKTKIKLNTPFLVNKNNDLAFIFAVCCQKQCVKRHRTLSVSLTEWLTLAVGAVVITMNNHHSIAFNENKMFIKSKLLENIVFGCRSWFGRRTMFVVFPFFHK